MRHRFALLLALVLVASACEDDGGSTTTELDSTSETTDAGEDATTEPGDVEADGATDATTATDTGETTETDATTAQDVEDTGEPPVTECNDGIDNDGDGLVDWAYDTGCWSAEDGTEAAGTRAEESGWTTFDPDSDSQLIYVSSSDGDDGNDGLSPETAVATPARGAELVRAGAYDFLLFKRGDVWRAETIGDGRVARRFKSGRDAEHPIVVSSYGDSTERPRFEVDTHFIDDDGNARSFIAVIGLHFASYRKDPADPEFNGADGGALRFVAADSSDVLFEGNYLEYGEFVVQNGSRFEIRRNVVYRSYHVGTCAYNDDGSRNPNGDNTFRPSGIFAGGVTGLTIVGNVWDENGWNPDVAEACATIYNHDLYLSGNSDLIVRNNLILRASSIGLKMAANSTGASQNITIENNLFAEGEIGLSMGGNSNDPARFTNARVLDNVFTDIGRSQPTTRNLTWYIGISDNVDTEITGNLLIHQPALSNPEGIHLTGNTNTNLDIHDNLLHGMGRRAFYIQAQDAWSNIRLASNTVSSNTDTDCTVTHSGPFTPLTYTSNAYSSQAPSDAWFCIDNARNDLAGWQAASSEADATEAQLSLPEPSRNLDTYATHLGLGSTLAEFAAAARTLSRHAWRPELTAPAAANWIREGYGWPTR